MDARCVRLGASACVYMRLHACRRAGCLSSRIAGFSTVRVQMGGDPL